MWEIEHFDTATVEIRVRVSCLKRPDNRSCWISRKTGAPPYMGGGPRSLSNGAYIPCMAGKTAGDRGRPMGLNLGVRTGVRPRLKPSYASDQAIGSRR